MELAELVRARNHLHAAGLDRGVGERDPGGHLPGRLEAEIGRILVPAHIGRVARVLGPNREMEQADIRTDHVLDGVEDGGMVDDLVDPREQEMRLEILPFGEFSALGRLELLHGVPVSPRLLAGERVDRVDEAVAVVALDLLFGQLLAHGRHPTPGCRSRTRQWVRRDIPADKAKMGQGPVSCPSCGHENPAGARFCNACGAHLAAPTITPEPRSYTPRHLVEKILASQSALRGERKLVTVLFADVVRSMDLAERVDPEEWHRLLDRLFRILAGGVHRYEGTINQYTGDGIMALFGAPIAHEDHVQRACAAALDLARELGALAEDVRRLAPPGGITVTEQTARLAEGFFDFLDRGEQNLKGARVPVRVFELRGPGQIQSRLDSSRARGFSRFVGRERELALLERALRETQSGRPKVVLVTAEPGAGKSRLCHEFVERT